MYNNTINLLAISGSLRENSSNNAIINFVGSLLPSTIKYTVYKGLGNLPPFDGNENAAAPVQDFRQQVKEADGILICTPEYAFGVPGILKNALDWTVYSGEFTNKPVAVVTAATGGEKAHLSLLLTLTALSSKVTEGARLLIPFVRTKLNDKGEVSDPQTVVALQAVVDALLEVITAEQPVA